MVGNGLSIALAKGRVEDQPFRGAVNNSRWARLRLGTPLWLSLTCQRQRCVLVGFGRRVARPRRTRVGFGLLRREGGAAKTSGETRCLFGIQQ
jgi:hypothetical protein